MKVVIAGVLGAVFALAAGAQTQQSVDLSKTKPVPSPNRTTFSSLAASGAKLPGGGGGVGPSSSAAITVVDAGGKLVGRWMMPLYSYSWGYAVLIPYNGQFMTAAISPHYSVNGAPSGALDWGIQYGQLFYESADCTGNPTVSVMPSGVNYSGVPAADNTGRFMLVADNRTLAVKQIHSVYYFAEGQAGVCGTYIDRDGMPNPQRMYVASVLGTVPLSSFGVAPLSLK